MYYKEVDKRYKESMIKYLRKHFRYHTMNSWNKSTSYANNIKLYNIDKPVDVDCIQSNKPRISPPKIKFKGSTVVNSASNIERKELSIKLDNPGLVGIARLPSTVKSKSASSIPKQQAVVFDIGSVAAMITLVQE